uniref:Uncharacterized protein n=1 Tax=Kalanchoe fedtschenkoi TaxID=63787 RepID=A0A7N0RFR0_KALFE
MWRTRSGIIPPIQNSYSSYCYGSCDIIFSVVDMGTGAGLPGIILAIACPDWNVTLMESMKKGCIFLEHAVESRYNLGQNQEYRVFYDVAVARAVAEVRILVWLGGLFVALKGHDPKEAPKTRAVVAL